jgi:hypothetical protein
MNDHGSRHYFERRAEQERFAAAQAANERTARPHRELADRYQKLAVDGEAPRQEPADPLDGILSSDFTLLP